jgi:hypothetical protein
MGNENSICYVKEIIEIKKERYRYTFKTARDIYILRFHPNMEDLFDDICLIQLYSHNSLDTCDINILYRIKRNIILINNNNTYFLVIQDIKFIFEKNISVFHRIENMIDQLIISSIPPERVVSPKQHSFTIFIDAKCPVCLEEITQVFVRECKHGLCENCNKKVDKCPICRN